MGKFLLGVLIGIVVTVVGITILGLAFGRLFATKQPSVASNSVLVVALSGEVPEAAPVDLTVPFLQKRGNPTVRDLWTTLHAAAKDASIKAIVLEPQALGLGSAKLQEIREELLDFKKSGKPVYAFLQNPSSREYYLAATADKVFLSPDDMLNVKGVHAQVFYYKNALDKLGITFQVDHIGTFKDAGDMFTRTNMSPETREVLNSVVEQVFSDFCSSVAADRHKTADQIRALVDQGPFTASQAHANGLIDVVGYEDEMYSDLNRRVGSGTLAKADIRTYVQAKPGAGDRIAVIVGEGEILPGDPDSGMGSEGRVTFAGMKKIVEQVRADNSIKGVILRVDSPGGDAVASDEILHQIKLLSAGTNAKPLVVSFSDLAASGGYYMSMTGDTIVSYPNTITGSIGVLYARPNIQGLLGKLGVTQDSVSRGKLSNIDSLTEPLSDAAEQKLHESIMETYQTFVSRVAAARRKTYDQIEPLAQGRVWMGTQAKSSNLVDELGGLNRAVAIIRQKAKLTANGDTNLVLYPPKRSLWEVIMQSSNEVRAEVLVRNQLRTVIPGLPAESLLHGGVLRLLPYTITVQ